MTDRPTEQIHQPEQLTNISVSNLMEVGNSLEEYCLLAGRTIRPDLHHSSFSDIFFFFAVVATLETISEVSLQLLCQTEIQNTCHLLFCYCSVSQPVFKDLEAQFKERTQEFETTKKSIVGKKVACVQLLFPLLFERNTRRRRAG